MSRPWRTLACAAVLLIAGCRTLPVTPPPPVDWPSEKAARQALTHWEMSGRAAVATPNDGFNASLHWVQNGDTSEARLKGALGVGGLRVVARGGVLEVETSKGEYIGPDEAAAVLAEAVGFDLPVTELRYWLLGVPAPGSPAEERVDEQGRLVALSQEDWTLTFDRFEQVNGSWLPGRIKLERGPVRVRVVADRWRLGHG